MSEDRGRRIRHAIAKVLRVLVIVIRAAFYVFLAIVWLAYLIKDPVGMLAVIGGITLVFLIFMTVFHLIEWLES